MSTPINQLTLAQSRALLAATKRDGVTLTPEARERITEHVSSLEGVPATTPRRPVAVAWQTKPGQAKTAPRAPRPAKGQGIAPIQSHAHPHPDSPAPRPVAQRPAGREPVSPSAPQARSADRYLVRVTSFRIRLLDEDNLVVKWFVDALRYAGVLPSDAPDRAHIEVAQVKVAHKHEEKTVIEITPPKTAKERATP